MIIYITKYATTKGILEAEGIATLTPEMVEVKIRRNGYETGYDAYFHEGEWFTDRSIALKNAIDRQVKQIKSLRRRLEKVQTMDLTKIERF